MDDDDDIRAALAAAHEPAPPFERVLAAARPPRAIPRLAFATVATAAAVIAIGLVAWPARDRSPPPDAATVALDLTPELRATTLATPLDPLLVVPGLATLGTTPAFGDVPSLDALPRVPGGHP